ncbi:MAG: transposase [bacterium]|nr:transposase [bacterium]
MGYFDVFDEHVDIGMKEVRFSVLNKIQTIISSVAVGCNHIKEINHKLVPYSTVANLLGMERFPDQSQINRLLRRIGLKDVLDLERSLEINIGRYILNELPEKIDIDIDSTGLVVLGDTYEFSQKGYFPNKRGKEGYQLTLASSSSFPKFILGYILDPGNIPPGARLWDIIYQVENVLGDLCRIGIIRADGIHGIGQDIEGLLEHGFSFCIKGKDPRTAQRFARDLCYEDWYPIDYLTRVAEGGIREIPNCKYPTRVILIEEITGKGKKGYRHLYTDIPTSSMDEVETYTYYKERQDIEATIKFDRNGFNIGNLRTRKFYGIEGFLSLSFMTQNLINLFRKKVLSQTGLEKLGMQELVEILMDIPAKCSISDNQLKLAFPMHHNLSRAFFEEKKRE